MISFSRRSSLNTVRGFHLNIVPNFTLVNVEKPPCFLRKFSPDGKKFIAATGGEVCSAGTCTQKFLVYDSTGKKVAVKCEFVDLNVESYSFDLFGLIGSNGWFVAFRGFFD